MAGVEEGRNERGSKRRAAAAASARIGLCKAYRFVVARIRAARAAQRAGSSAGRRGYFCSRSRAPSLARSPPRAHSLTWLAARPTRKSSTILFIVASVRGAWRVGRVAVCSGCEWVCVSRGDDDARVSLCATRGLKLVHSMPPPRRAYVGVAAREAVRAGARRSSSSDPTHPLFAHLPGRLSGAPTPQRHNAVAFTRSTSNASKQSAQQPH